MTEATDEAPESTEPEVREAEVAEAEAPAAGGEPAAPAEEFAYQPPPEGRLLPFDWTDLLVVALLSILGGYTFIKGIGDYPLWEPWEPKYAAAVREMVERDDLLTPYYEGRVRWTKPILIYWAMWAAMELGGGNNEFTARLPSGVAGVLGMLLVYWCVRRLRGRWPAIMAAVALGTMPQYFYMARQVMPDTILVAFLAGTMGFYALARFGDARFRRRHFVLAYACLGLAFLAKGPLAGAITLGSLCLFWLLGFDSRRLLTPKNWWRDVKAFLGYHHLLLGIVVFGLVAGPWYCAMYYEHGWKFIDAFVRGENWHRLSEPVRGHDGASNTYILPMLIGMSPWIGFVPVAMAMPLPEGKDGRDTMQMRWYFVSWAICIFCLFTLSGSKIDHYILPITPVFAVLAGLVWGDYFSRAGTGAARCGFLASWLFLWIFVRDIELFDDNLLFDVFTVSAELYHDPLDQVLFIFLLAWGAVMLLGVLLHRSRAVAILAIILAFIHACYFSHVVLPEHAVQRSVKVQIDLYNQLRNPDSTILFYGTPQEGMVYYMGLGNYESYNYNQLGDLLRSAKDQPDPFLLVRSNQARSVISAMKRLKGHEWVVVGNDNFRYTLLAYGHGSVDDEAETEDDEEER